MYMIRSRVAAATRVRTRVPAHSVHLECTHVYVLYVHVCTCNTHRYCNTGTRVPVPVLPSWYTCINTRNREYSAYVTILGTHTRILHVYSYVQVCPYST